MEYSISTVLVIVLAFVLAGTVKGMLGLGLPTVAISVLSFRVGMADAVTLLVMPTILTNLWQLLAGPRFVHLIRRFAGMLIATLVGAFIGVRLLVNGEMAMVLLGVVLLVYGLLGLSKLQFTVPPRWEGKLSPAVGLLTGVLYGSTGLGITSVPYVTALGLSKDELVQAMGLVFSAMSLSLAIALAGVGKFELGVAGASTATLIPAFIGMALGSRMRARMNAVLFRKVFFAAMVVLGGYTVIHALN